ncbi:hypothetical protein ACFPRL_21160 [Pseudoclavibacter helvolus]
MRVLVLPPRAESRLEHWHLAARVRDAPRQLDELEELELRADATHLDPARL